MNLNPWFIYFGFGYAADTPQYGLTVTDLMMCNRAIPSVIHSTSFVGVVHFW